MQQVKIWEDRNAVPLVVLRPHEDRPVSSVNFLTSPDHPDNIILVTSVCTSELVSMIYNIIGFLLTE